MVRPAANLGAALGGDTGVQAVAHYVMSLSDSNHDATLAQQGSARFAVCSACHGADGAGNPVIGAPNLTDDIWLHGGSIESIKHAINNGLQNTMPANGRDRLHIEPAGDAWRLVSPVVRLESLGSVDSEPAEFAVPGVTSLAHRTTA